MGATPLTKYQFERVGYFCVDYDSTAEKVKMVAALVAVSLVRSRKVVFGTGCNRSILFWGPTRWL